MAEKNSPDLKPIGSVKRFLGGMWTTTKVGNSVTHYVNMAPIRKTTKWLVVIAILASLVTCVVANTKITKLDNGYKVNFSVGSEVK